MSEQIRKSYKELVELKYQLYNSLFLTLPLDAVEQTGLLLPLLQEACSKGFANGLSPVQIVDGFFNDHNAELNEEERISFLFKVIQYVERQIVLIDALEEAAYNKIHRIGDSNKWRQIKEKAERKGVDGEINKLFDEFGIRVVLTAHPTQFYPGRVLAICNDLMHSITNGDVGLSRDLLQQLGKTPFYRKVKPSAYDEAMSLIWYLANVFYPAAGEVLDRLSENFPGAISNHSRLITMGFWPGGDRDGNPFVTVNTTRKVAKRLRAALVFNYHKEIKYLKRRLSFKGIYEKIHALDELMYEEISDASGNNNISLDYLKKELDDIETILINEHQGLFLDKLQSFKRKVSIFGFFFASIDVRQDSRVIGKTFDELCKVNPTILPENYSELSETEQVDVLLNVRGRVDFSVFDDELIKDTLESFSVIKEIQELNGEQGAHRYIISNCRGPVDVAKVYAMAHLCSWGNSPLTLDIVPLFETIDDLKYAGQAMSVLYANKTYTVHLHNRRLRQTVMLGFSDGTKDGGYFMANWSIYRAKEDISLISRKHEVEVVFFDGRGGPPARGGGNTHLFYAAMGKNIDKKQIQLTVQGQTISSQYGIKEAAVHNIGHLLTAGIENNLFKNPAAEISDYQRSLINDISECSYKKYEALKQHELFMPFLEHRSTLKYYGLANIGSRPTKRGGSKKLEFDDLRAIPFVGAWSQLKQNVPGFFGVGTALKEQEDKGNLKECIELYNSSIFFKTLLANSMQSMSKSNFDISRYMENDPVYGQFWKIIYDEFILSKQMVLKVSGYNELLDDNVRSQMSIGLRERVVLPLLSIQQFALMKIHEAQEGGNNKYLSEYENMVMRSLFGNINASRNSV